MLPWPGTVVWAEIGLFFEQFRVRAQPVEHEDEDIIVDFVDQEPVRFDMAFPGALVVAG